MKKIAFLPLFALLLLGSCKDELSEMKLETETPAVSSSSLTDSCAFTIDGKVYTATKLVTKAIGNERVNIDNSTDMGDLDSVLYTTEFSWVNPDIAAADFGRLSIVFVKKYAKTQLQKEAFPGNPYFKAPDNKYELYQPGTHPYAVDFERFNTQNGVGIVVGYGGSNKVENLRTMLHPLRRYPSTLGYDCQQNSSFQITSFTEQPDGSYLVEAKFSANVFKYKEAVDESSKYFFDVDVQKRVENGYIRFRLPI